MKLKVVVGIILLIPVLSFATTTMEKRSINETTIRGESCEQDLKGLILKHCKYANSNYLKEIHKDSYNMHTQAEDTREELFIYSDGFMHNIYSIKRYTDFDNQQEYGNYCYISISCLEQEL